MKNSILKYSLYIIAALTIFSCQKENKPEVKPEKKEVKPTSTAQCISTELKALKEIAKLNPDAHLFEGENPEQWKNVNIKWAVNKDGKYVVKGLEVKNDAKVENLNIALDGKKMELPNLESVDIASAFVSKFSVKYMPALNNIRINGDNKSKINTLDLRGGDALKEITIENMPVLNSIMIGGDKLEKLTLNNLPKLDEQENLKFRTVYDEDGEAKATTLNELVFKGDFNALKGIYLTDLELKKFTLEAKLPKLENLALQDNKLSGSLGIKDLENLKSLYLQKNSLTSINVSNCPNLEEMNVSRNKQLSSVITNLPKLKNFDLDETEIKEIDLSNNDFLKSLSITKTKLTSIKFGSKNTKLDRINLSDNQLEALEFPKEAASISLITVKNNKIKTLDLSNFNAIERILINNNILENLTVHTDNTSLENLECQDNHLNLKNLREIKRRLKGLKNWIIAPQTALNRTNKEQKTIDAREEINELHLNTLIQKKEGSNPWANAPSNDYQLNNGIYTITGSGKYRVILKGTFLEPTDPKFDVFSSFMPYIIGEYSTL